MNQKKKQNHQKGNNLESIPQNSQDRDNQGQKASCRPKERLTPKKLTRLIWVVLAKSLSSQTKMSLLRMFQTS